MNKYALNWIKKTKKKKKGLMYGIMGASLVAAALTFGYSYASKNDEKDAISSPGIDYTLPSKNQNPPLFHKGQGGGLELFLKEEISPNNSPNHLENKTVGLWVSVYTTSVDDFVAYNPQTFEIYKTVKRYDYTPSGRRKSNELASLTKNLKHQKKPYKLQIGRMEDMEDVLKQNEKYIQETKHIFKKYGLLEDLAYIPLNESLYNAKKVSSHGAKGIWQLMPNTARQYDLTINHEVDERSDPKKSREAAAHYLQHLSGLFHDWDLVVLAYNQGENGVLKLLKKATKHNPKLKEKYENQTLTFADVEPYIHDHYKSTSETRNYVAKFHASMMTGKTFLDKDL